jgi:hypothetical protein
MNNLIRRNEWGNADQIFYPENGYFNDNAAAFSVQKCNEDCKKRHPHGPEKRKKCFKSCEAEAKRQQELALAKLKNEPELGFNQAVSQLSAGPSAMVAEGESDNTALVVGAFLVVLLMAGVGFWYYKKSTATVPALVKA